VRLYGHGTVIPAEHPDASPLLERFPELPGARSVIHVLVERVSTSCGYGVPILRTVEERSRLLEWAQKKGDEGLHQYRREHNDRSIDGLPALTGEG
jgi:hypothetical protein